MAVSVQPKVFELLLHLARERHRVVPTDELHEQLWPGVAVSDAALYRLVKEARSAVDDDGRTQRVLRTHPRQGLRFIAEAACRGAEGEDPRLSGLASDARRAVAVSALLGEKIELPLLAEMLGVEPSSLLETLGPALATGLLDASEDEPGCVRFTEPALRDSARSSLDPSARADAHRRAAQGLEARAPTGETLDEIARHRAAAALAGDVRAAVTAGLAAARDAARRGALDVAADHLSRTAAVLTLEGRSAEGERSDLLRELVELLRRAGRFDEARASAFEAADAARAAGSAEQVARSAVAVPGLLLHGRVDDEWVAIAEEALTGLSKEPTLVRGELLNRLAYHLYWSRDAARSRACNREAREIGEACGDPGLLAWVCMIDRMLAAGEGAPRRRLLLAKRAVEHAACAGQPDTELYAREQVVHDCMADGDVPSAREEERSIEALAERERLTWPARVPTMLALHHGDFSAAERYMSELGVAEAGADPLASQYRAPQLMWLRFLQGRLGELVPLMRAFVARSGELPAWRAALALGEFEAGEIVEARREFEGLAARDFVDLPQDFLTSTALVCLAELCARLGDEARAGHLYEHLAQEGPAMLVLPRASVVFGPTEYFLGILARVLDERENALAHGRAALALNESTEGRPALARTHAELAWLLAMSDPAGRSDARPHAECGSEIARALGMTRVAMRCQEALELATSAHISQRHT